MTIFCSAHQVRCPDGCPIQYRATRAELERAVVELAACRDLLAEAIGWIGDPSAYYGTQGAKDFDARVEAELAKRTPNAHR